MKKTATLYLEVEYDDEATDPDSIAIGLDGLMETATSTPDILDDYGNPKIGEFFVLFNGPIEASNEMVQEALKASVDEEEG